MLDILKLLKGVQSTRFPILLLNSIAKNLNFNQPKPKLFY